MSDKVLLLCTNNNQETKVDVLSQNDTRIKIVIPGAYISMELYRKSVNDVYVTERAGLEFTTDGKTI